MNARTFIITFDPTDPALDYVGVKAFFKQSQLFKAWWHHIPYVFLVLSEMSAEQISEQIREFAREARFLVTAVDLTASDGNLTERGWQWITRRADAASDSRAA